MPDCTVAAQDPPPCPVLAPGPVGGSHGSLLMWALWRQWPGGCPPGWSPQQPGAWAFIFVEITGEGRTGGSRAWPRGQPPGEPAGSGISGERLLTSCRSEGFIVFKTSTCLWKPRAPEVRAAEEGAPTGTRPRGRGFAEQLVPLRLRRFCAWTLRLRTEQGPCPPCAGCRSQSGWGRGWAPAAGWSRGRAGKPGHCLSSLPVSGLSRAGVP